MRCEVFTVLMQMRQYENALAEAEKAHRPDPNQLGVLNEAASILARVGKPEEAVPLIEKRFAIIHTPFMALSLLLA